MGRGSRRSRNTCLLSYRGRVRHTLYICAGQRADGPGRHDIRYVVADAYFCAGYCIFSDIRGIVSVVYFKKIKEKSQYFYISEIYSNNRMNILINLESKPKVRNFLIAILLCLISCSLNNI